MNRCEQCQAGNPPGAQWCGQCYAPLVEERTGEGEASAVTSGGAAPQPGPVGGEAAPRPSSGADAHAGAGVFRQRDGDVEWACVTCEAYNPLELATCAVCGTALAARFEGPSAEPDDAATDWRAALALSVLLPGSGHVLAGRQATGIARALLFVVWFGGALLLTGGGGAGFVFAPLYLGAFALWAATIVDIVNLPRQGPELLRGRVLVWLVVGVTLLSLFGLAAGVASLG